MCQKKTSRGKCIHCLNISDITLIQNDTQVNDNLSFFKNLCCVFHYNLLACFTISTQIAVKGVLLKSCYRYKKLNKTMANIHIFANVKEYQMHISDPDHGWEAQPNFHIKLIHTIQTTFVL